MIHFCLLEPGDVGLVPDPSYPSYEACVNMTGARTERVPLLPENAFLPDLDSIPSEAIRAAKLIWVNYPNNPTGATATPDFYRRLISWAKENDVAVVSDNAYSEVYFDEHRPVSFLEFPGARNVGVEIHSLSKSYNCCGWRSGMLVGNKDLVAAVGRIKVHSDRGMFYPLQLTSVQALNSPADLMAGRNRIYQERRDLLVQGLSPMGFKVYSPRATFYLWAGVPNGVSSLDFCYQALEKANVWMIPGFLYGPHGEGYVRIAFTQPVERLAEAVRRLEKFLS
jgi:LL-diaminopimelate aminotransferase